MVEELRAVILHVARYFDEVARALRASVGSTEVASVLSDRRALRLVEGNRLCSETGIPAAT
jgi:antitoxin component HigA of HigAB toxin-antitoxin module